MSRRGGRWGMNFISASGPQSHLSMNSLQAAEMTAQELQDRSNDPSKARSSSYPPPPSFAGAPPRAQTSFAPSYNPQRANGGSSRAFSHLGKRRMQDDDDYFNDDEEKDDELEYLPAPGSPAAQGGRGGGETVSPADKAADSDDSDDPLDKFMQGIEEEVDKLKSNDGKKKKDDSKKTKRNVRDDIEQEDEMEAYLRFMEENPNVGVFGDEDEIYEYDEEGNVISMEKKTIDPLPPIDHSLINYTPFSKNFYIQHPDIAALSETGVMDLLKKLNIRLSGISPPRPVCSFAHLNLDGALMNAIRQAGYTQPMPIQAAAVPAALSGRDIVGIAKTGSGKTVAFLWPMITHIMAQPELKLGDGPIGIVCVPTRELAIQIYTEAKKLAKPYNLNVVCAYGGGSMWEQQKACEVGCEILICTPGRLIDLVKKKATNLRRVTFLVFDEADKMFNLGFEPQVRSIANHVRPDKQALLFSATFKSRIERLARDILTDPVRIVQGEVGEANEDITQIIEIFNKWDEKWDWLTRNMVRFTAEGSVLIFVTRKAHCVEVVEKLKARDMKVLLLHGDMHQSDRNTVIHKFKHNEAPILVATDVASRGLDIPSIHTVVNYEVARDIDTHTHRVGRTGRAGVKGTAYTLFVAGRDPADFAAHLVRHLELAGQAVPPRLLEIARQCVWFAENRAKAAAARAEHPRPGIGFQPRERPLPSRTDFRAGQGTSESASTGSASSISDLHFPSWQPGCGPATVAASSAHQTDRLAAMKAVFASQYNRRFVSAGVESTKYTHPELLGATTTTATTTSDAVGEFRVPQAPPPSGVASALQTKRRRSRWD
ncbi:ATP dependent RNA helicase DDX42 [Echinococcus multilocularis]|uniref:RNA helicase n=1 Tax=Echinococcus multilocularis TaxID=6211 RepID=A0A068YC07_ECHMU|nr:ATP dependent RNA helicase DDX42 [Echinococcus multilocularis]